MRSMTLVMPGADVSRGSDWGHGSCTRVHIWNTTRYCADNTHEYSGTEEILTGRILIDSNARISRSVSLASKQTLWNLSFVGLWRRAGSVAKRLAYRKGLR